MKQRIELFAKEMDRSKAYIIRQALEEYLQDMEDYLEAKHYKATYDPAQNLSLAQIKRKYKLK